MFRKIMASIYAIGGFILFTVGMWYLPVEGWIKLLIWVGIGMLMSANSLARKE